jgi:hypothetical protein
MDRRLHRLTSVAAALLALAAVGCLALGPAHQAQAADSGARHGMSGDLFPNYYTPPGYGGAVAPLYVCPRPTPPLVGHTYVTYQPLMPHEFLYEHARTYHRYNPGEGWTKTRVTWSACPLLNLGRGAPTRPVVPIEQGMMTWR